MSTAERGAPLWLLPGGGDQPLPEVHRERAGLALVTGFIALAAAAPAYAFAAPGWVWEPESLLIVLLAFAFLSAGAAVVVRDMVTIDASFIAALIGVVFLGPLPAAVIYGLTMVDDWVRRGGAVPLVANTASAFWACWAAAWTLGATSGEVPLAHAGVQDAPAIAIAGGVLLGVNYLVMTVPVNVIWHGHDFRALAEQELAGLAPASALLVAAGTVTALLYEFVGFAGLAPLALLVLLPRVVVPRVARTHEPGKLDREAATALYARAIAAGIEFDAVQTRVLLDAATHLGGSKRLTRIEDFDRVMQTVLYCRERWDGKGGLVGLSGEAIPPESRVLAVAQRLAALSAKGTRELTPRQAIDALRPGAGTEFDPGVVAAARYVIENEVLVSAPRPGGRAPLLSFGSSQSRPGGRIRSRRSSSRAKRARFAQPPDAAPTTLPEPRLRRR